MAGPSGHERPLLDGNLHQSSVASSVSLVSVCRSRKIWNLGKLSLRALQPASKKRHKLSVMLCVDLGCIGLCSLGPQELSWAVASICQAYPLGLEGLNRRKSRTERLYGMAATLWVQLWGSCVALPLLWLNFKLPALLCCGPAVAKLTFLSILNRASPDTIWPAGRLLLKCFWDAPLLLISYAADTVFSSILPWPFFFNGKNGELVSDINAQLCMGGRPLARHVSILLEHEVHSVVNMTEEWRGPVEVYKQHGIEQLQLPTLDTTPPSLEHLRDGVAFVRARLKATGGRGRIYIHCKGGRGRASCMAAACLMANQGMDLESALRMLKATRPVVELGIVNYPSLQAFAAECRQQAPV
ncbi:PTPMT1 [Symbiodinium sp. CCMP2456]|nr:PTPMT1 [Symbiodinium sp. CCMP2456]